MSNKDEDLTFSSSSEVKTFVRAKLGMPTNNDKGKHVLYRSNIEGKLRDADGKDMLE